MRVTVVGCWGGSPRPGGACSGYLVQHEGTNLLLDCGAGVASRVQLACPLERIDHVVVSHFHHDHASDAGVLMFARLVQRQLGLTDRDLVFYGPSVEVPETGAAADAGADAGAAAGAGRAAAPHALGAPSAPDTHVAFDLARLAMPGASRAVGVDEGTPVRVGPFALDFVRTRHPAKCLAMRVSCDDGTTLAYTADAALTGELAAFCAGVDVLICECSLYAGYDGQAMGHMSCEDVVTLARAARPATLVLSHLPIYGDPRELLAWVRDRVRGDEVDEVLLASEPAPGGAPGDMLSLTMTKREG